jgi:hypothetical protein
MNDNSNNLVMFYKIRSGIISITLDKDINIQVACLLLLEIQCGNKDIIVYRDSSVSTVTKLRAGRPGFDSRQGQKILFVTASRPVLVPIQPSIQWVLGFFPRW